MSKDELCEEKNKTAHLVHREPEDRRPAHASSSSDLYDRSEKVEDE